MCDEFVIYELCSDLQKSHPEHVAYWQLWAATAGALTVSVESLLYLEDR